MVDMTLEATIRARRSGRSFDDRPLPLETLQRLLFAGQGITGEGGNRTVPSAHALHPLKLAVVAGNVDGLHRGLHRVDQHSLELAVVAGGDLRREVEAAALEEQPWIGRASAIIAVCADFETPKQAFADQPPKGKRGSGYVFIEAGAVAQNVQLQAAAEGLSSVLVAGFDDEATSKVLQLDLPFEPVLLLCVGWPSAA